MTVILLLFWAPVWILDDFGNFGISRGPTCLAASGLWWTVEKWSDRGTAVEAVTNMAAVRAADMPYAIGIPDKLEEPPDEEPEEDVWAEKLMTKFHSNSFKKLKLEEANDAWRWMYKQYTVVVYKSEPRLLKSYTTLFSLQVFTFGCKSQTCINDYLWTMTTCQRRPV